MRTHNLWLVTMHLASTHASKLLVASYKSDNGTTGALQTLEFDEGNSSLRLTHTSQDCGALPSWLDLSSDRSSVTCIDENDPGGMTMLTIKSNGSLEKSFNTSVLGGPVSNVYFNNASAVAIAHYMPPAISTFAVNSNKTYTPLQNFHFNLSSVDPEHQDTAHVHQALLDPTGQYLLFPDLGADLVHVYCASPQTNMLIEHAPLKSKSGYGPRHAVFWSPEHDPESVFLFVIHELSNKIVSYAVDYLPAGGLAFYEVDEVSTFGDREIPTKDAAASEITVTPDNKFVIAANRLAPIFNLTNPDPNNSTAIQSDSLITLRPTDCGMLDFVSLTASGGMNPRHFSLNEDGSKIAVAHQESKTVVIWSRDCESGAIEKQIAVASNLGPGGLTNVQWLMG